MRRVLFVDDDRATLDALRSTLRREQWDMAFAGSGEEALARLAEQPYDAIVSDLGMPAMDGPQLLAHVRDRHPHVIRLCLSGSLDNEAFLRALPLAHQFLNKPCDPDTLREVIDRACGLRGVLQCETTRALIGRLHRLPATVEICHALSRAVAEPNAHAADITGIVSQDAVLCVKILQLVNSAMFRRTAPITSIQAAITFVGLEMVKSLALSACVFNALEAAPETARLLQDLQARSLRKAELARALSQDSRHGDEAFTAALLLDVGQAVLALDAPATFERAQATARAAGRPQHMVEQELFGVSHPQVGAYLLGLWGLPLELIEAVAYHHSPSRVEHAQTSVLAAVHVADAIVEATAEHHARLLDLLDAEFVARPQVSRLLKSFNLDVQADAQSAQRRIVPQ